MSRISPLAPATVWLWKHWRRRSSQDLNGDGTIGPTTVVIQTDGSTSLTEIANTYALYTGGAGPSLKYGGAAVTAGEFGTWTPIGAIQVSGGYDVAWKDLSSGQFTVWSTDSNGKHASESHHWPRQQSGSGNIGDDVPSGFERRWNNRTTTVVIQTDGSTSLTEIAIIYALYTGGAGPSLTMVAPLCTRRRVRNLDADRGHSGFWRI